MGAAPPVYVDGNEIGEGGAGLSSTLTMNHITIADHTAAPTVNGNISHDPQFVDAARHDYRLKPCAGGMKFGFEDDME